MAEDFSKFREYIKGKKAAVLGIGVSNIPLIRFLIKLGAHVTAFDKRKMEELDPKVFEFKESAEFILGDDYLNGLTGFDIIFRTPGMRPDVPELLKAGEEGAVITSEIQEFIRYCRGHVIGVTGSDGKSTTTTIIHELLKASEYNSWIGGNIGIPLFDKVEEIKEEDFAVVELSSFQLMDMEVSPETAVATNLSPNHLDIHKDMEEYIISKKNIFLHQDSEGLLVTNAANDITAEFKKEAPGKVLEFTSSGRSDAYIADGAIFLGDTKIIPTDEMKIIGIHNAENMMAAFLAVKEYVKPETMAEVASSFGGVKYRCQFIRELNGAKFYNNSIASSPTRTLATLKAFGAHKGRVNIILGGYDKNLDYDEMSEQGSDYFNNIILYGAAAPKIEESLKKYLGENAALKILHKDNFDDAVRTLINNSRPGDISILSPACASFDQFKNFEERGDRFDELINSAAD